MSCDGGLNFVDAGNSGYAGNSGFSGGGGKYKYRPKLKVKVTKDNQGDEKWVMVIDDVHIKENIKQPDPERQALSGSATAGIDGDVTYTYGDELPKKMIQAIVCTVMCCVLATPLTLLCMIPMIHKIRKTQRVLADGSLPGAREHYERSILCLALAFCWMIILFCTLAGCGVLLGIILGTVLSPDEQPCGCSNVTMSA